MSIEITGRHVEIKGNVKQHVREKAEAIISEFPRVENVHVILDGQKFHKLAEVVVQAKNRLRVEASASDEMMMAAVDNAMTKVSRQLRKARTKVQDHHK
jgi:putative sigma-54 modulation protein